MIMEEAYKRGDTIYILMDAKRAAVLMDDWVTHNYECDMLVHRSKKTEGFVVVETTDLLWARRIILWYKPNKVKIKSR